MSDRWRILVVDDERDTLDLIEMILRKDFDVICVNNGLEALEKMDYLEPDLIILDIMMPKFSGYQVCETLKKNLRYKETPIIFLSAKDSIADQKHGYLIGAISYLTKPFTPERLLKNLTAFFKYTPPVRKPKRASYEKICKEYIKPHLTDKKVQHTPRIIIEDDKDWVD